MDRKWLHILSQIFKSMYLSYSHHHLYNTVDVSYQHAATGQRALKIYLCCAQYDFSGIFEYWAFRETSPNLYDVIQFCDSSKNVHVPTAPYNHGANAAKLWFGLWELHLQHYYNDISLHQEEDMIIKQSFHEDCHSLCH